MPELDDSNHRYADAIAAWGASLSRLARGYEADPDRRGDLLQEIHIALWRSFAAFDGRCSLRTWVYRIAHNVAASHIVRNRRAAARLVDLETLETEPGFFDAEAQADRKHSAARLLDLIRKLAPVDRQTILLYLEGERAESIAEVTGLSAVNVATKIHRIKKLLGRQFQEGEPHAGRRS
ncbi:MAG: RNA polymerase sigma factor [Bryobacteraceae bacterium]